MCGLCSFLSSLGMVLTTVSNIAGLILVAWTYDSKSDSQDMPLRKWYMLLFPRCAINLLYPSGIASYSMVSL